MPWSVHQLPLVIQLTSIERLILGELDAVRAASARASAMRGPAFDGARDAPRLVDGSYPTLEIPRAALSVTVAAILDADAHWGVGRVRGLIFDLVERIDGEARRVGWL